MPIYNYHCSKCNSYDEYLVKSSEKHPPRCVCCGERGQLERLAVQPFSVGSNGKRSTAITSVEINGKTLEEITQKYEDQKQLMLAAGAKQLYEGPMQFGNAPLRFGSLWTAPNTANN